LAAAEPRDARRTPEQDYERRWALATLARALEALERDETEDGHTASFAELKAFLTEDGDASYREVAARLGQSEGAGGETAPYISSLPRDEVANVTSVRTSSASTRTARCRRRRHR